MFTCILYIYHSYFSTATYPNAYGQLSQAFTTQQPAVIPTPQREGKPMLDDGEGKGGG